MPKIEQKMKDGFIIFYVKDSKLLPVAMSSEQYNTLQNFIPAIFGKAIIQVIDKPMGEVYNMVEPSKMTCNSECGMRMKYPVSCEMYSCKYIKPDKE